MGFGSKLRKLDIYKKPEESLTEGTNIGGCISITTVILIGYFLYM